MTTLDEYIKNKKPIGLIRISPASPLLQKEHIASGGQNAADSTTTGKFAPGIYPLMAGMSPYSHGETIVFLPLAGEITASSHPSIFGGHITSNPPPQDLGKPRTISMPLPIDEVLRRDGNSPDPQGEDIHLFKEVGPAIRKVLERLIVKDLRSLARVVEGKDNEAALEAMSHKELEDFAGKLKVHTRWLAEAATTVQTLARRENHNNTGFLVDQRAENVSWVNKFSPEEIESAGRNKAPLERFPLPEKREVYEGLSESEAEDAMLKAGSGSRGAPSCDLGGRGGR